MVQVSHFFCRNDSLHIRKNKHYKAWGYKKNKKIKMKSIYESWLYRFRILQVPITLPQNNLDHKSKESILQIKNSESRSTRKESFDINIFIKRGNVDRKIMQPIKITSGPATRIEKKNQFRHFILTTAKEHNEKT